MEASCRGCKAWFLKETSERLIYSLLKGENVASKIFYRITDSIICKQKHLICVLLAALTFFYAAGAAAEQVIRVESPLGIVESESSAFQTIAELDTRAYEVLKEHEHVMMTNFLMPDMDRVDLELSQYSIVTKSTRIVIGTPNGDIPAPPPDIVLFRGSIMGKSGSAVFMGISPRGSHWIIEDGKDGVVITPLDRSAEAAKAGVHVIEKLSEVAASVPVEERKCGVEDHRVEWPGRSTAHDPVEAPEATAKVVRIAVDTDYEYYNQFNNYGLAQDYLFLLMGAVSSIYERDVGTKLALTFIRIWTTINDPYPDVIGGGKDLEFFRDYWVDNHNPGQPGFIERDLAQQLAWKGVEARGWYEVICDYSDGFSIAGGIARGDTNAESLVHDIRYSAHEIGHNFNAEHTHCLKDPATNDWIDKCATAGTCNPTQDCSTAPGTLMSYCHSCPGGYSNILTEFHAVNIGRMVSHVNDSCARSARNPSYVDWRNTSGTEDGTLANPYNTIKEGVEAVAPNGIVSIASGNYPENGWNYPNGKIIIWQPMKLRATGGNVLIGE